MRPKPIRSFTRGLAVLSALNRHGSATALTLARESGVPRATVYRLLETLLEDGYVGRGTADERFHLQLKVRSLSEGFEDEQWITTIAGPAVSELTRRISWPCDVSALQGLKMVVHETTHRIASRRCRSTATWSDRSYPSSAAPPVWLIFPSRRRRSGRLCWPCWPSPVIRMTRWRAIPCRCRA